MAGPNGVAERRRIAQSFSMPMPRLHLLISACLPFLLTMAGCSSVGVIKTANGSAYQVDCGGLLGTKLDCNKKAQELCPSGFNPVTSPPGTLVFTCANRPMPATAPI